MASDLAWIHTKRGNTLLTSQAENALEEASEDHRHHGDDRHLGFLCGRIGYPNTIRVVSGSEFIFRDMDFWADADDVKLDFSRPGKPTENGFIEAFDSKLRSECLNAHSFPPALILEVSMDRWHGSTGRAE